MMKHLYYMSGIINPMRRVIISLLLLLSSQAIMAQEEFYVKSLSADTRDLSARTSPRQDLNGRPCALLKVMAMDDIVSCGGVNIGDISTEGLVKLVYVPAVAKSVKLNFKYHYPLEITFADYGIDKLEGQTTYNLVLTTQKSEAVAQGGVVNQENAPQNVIPVEQSNVQSVQNNAVANQPASVAAPQPTNANTAPNGLSLEGITNPIIANLVRNMVRVEGGTFMMGATEEQGSDAADNEKPVHQVTLSDYYIGKYEVTQEEWQAVMGNNPSHFNDSGKLPVECVNCRDCQLFIQKLNSLTGQNFRLPTEAEWEYAARGGNKSKGYKYAGSNKIKDVAWYDGNSRKKTHDVGGKQPNELGLYDMSGNVWEWCSDRSGSYSSFPQTNPTGAPSGDSRVIRGGYWGCLAMANRVSKRYNEPPSYKLFSVGLRLAL